MATHFDPSPDDDAAEQAPCGTWPVKASNGSSNWAHVDCALCQKMKAKISAAHEASEAAIVEQMGGMAAYMLASAKQETCRLRVSDYLTKSGSVLIESQVCAEIAYNHRSRPLCWTSKKLTNAIDAHLAERLAGGHDVSTRVMPFRGLDPDSPLFVSGRIGEEWKICTQKRDGKTYYSANQLSRLYTRLFSLAGIEGASAQSGRRTLAVKSKRRGIDLRHLSEILDIESLEAVKKHAQVIQLVWGT